MPPASDGLAARAKRAKKPGRRSPRPRGGQPGHEGHSLAWRGDPDRVAVVMPAQCAGCGHDLAGLEGTVAARVQVSDTPPVRLQVTEYRRWRGGPSAILDAHRCYGTSQKLPGKSFPPG
jgi:transposase